MITTIWCVLYAYAIVRALPVPGVDPINSAQPLSNNYSNTFFSNNYERGEENINDTVVEMVHVSVDDAEDTLVVANRDESEKLDPGGELDAIIVAEHDRDVAMAKSGTERAGAPPVRLLEIPRDDVGSFRKQLNISSAALDSIMQAETGRDESLTDIMFRPISDYDVPQIAFLAAAELNATRTAVHRKDYVELVELRTSAVSLKRNSSGYTLANVTGHDLENDTAPDTRFTDLQTLFLACFATLVPLLTVLMVALLVRCMVRRWCPYRWRPPPDDSSGSDNSDDKPPLDDEYKPVSSPSLSCAGSEEAGGRKDSVPAPTGNGSIITMTLKNNHLIVETEERNVRNDMRNGRETKMKYSPDSDGIFVVEVQQSASYRPAHAHRQSPARTSPPHRTHPPHSDQHALVHRAQELHDTQETQDLADATQSQLDRDKSLELSCTGLSISDLSVSSGDSRAPSYAYTAQTGYEQGPLGYPVYPGYYVPDPAEFPHDSSREPLLSKTPTDPDKPVITAAIFKQDSIVGSELLQGPGYCIEGSSDGPLLSDVQAREVSLHQLHNRMEAAGTATVEATTELHRADSLPPRLDDTHCFPEEQNLGSIGEEKEDQCMTRVKLSSLPIIMTEEHAIVKKLLPAGSPKFKLSDTVTAEDILLPLITITEEQDNSVLQNGEESVTS